MSERRAVEAFRRQTEPDPAAMERIRQAVLVRRRRRWVPAAVGAGLLAAASALLLLRPAPPLSESLIDTDARALTDDIFADFNGEGTVSGTEDAARIAWEHGRVTLSVTPDQGIDLTVQTEEAIVEVVGTVFTVDRDELGTSVSVERGRVIVTCADDDAPHLLLTDQQRTCLPVDMVGLTRRATALRDASASPDTVLHTVDRALTAPGQTPELRAELTWLRLTLLIRLARYNDAAAEVQAFIATDPPLHRAEAEEMQRQLRVAGY